MAVYYKSGVKRKSPERAERYFFKNHHIMTIKPKDNGAALRNPGMGWFLAYFTDNSDTGFGARLKDGDVLDWFPGCNGISFRVGWGRVEPGDGKFDWDYTDKIAQNWIAAGKQVGLNWICFSTAGTPTSTPWWVKEKGAKGRNYSGNNHFIPTWEDPVFTAAFEAFLKAAGQRYDGKGYVAFVEVGSLGTWGEGHSWSPTGEIPAIPTGVKKNHLEMYRRWFPRTPLYVNDDYITSCDRPQEIAAIARDLGFGIADWSLAVNHRDFEPAARLADPVWRQRPILLEHHHYGDAVKKGWWGDGEELMRAMERFHASQMRIHWFPDEFLNGDGKELKGNRALVERINRRIGYRLQIVEAQWPDKIKPGEKAEFVVTLRNGGVAPCYSGVHNGSVAVTLKDANGKIVASGVGKTDRVGSLEPGPSAERAKPRPYPVVLDPPRLPAGKYGVFVSIGDEKGVPIYALPHAGDDGVRRYRLGEIAIGG